MFVKSHKNIGKSRAKGAGHSNTIHLLVHDVIRAKFHGFGKSIQVDKTCSWKSWAELSCCYIEFSTDVNCCVDLDINKQMIDVKGTGKSSFKFKITDSLSKSKEIIDTGSRI